MTMSPLAPFDEAEYLKLPDPGGYVPRVGPPCPDCGSTTWQVTRHTKVVKDIDMKPVPTVVVSLHCPDLWDHRRQSPPRDLEILGTIDVRARAEAARPKDAKPKKEPKRGKR